MAGKTELIATVAGSLGLSKAQADTVVTSVIDSIADLTETGERLTLRNFGSFVKKTTSARTGRNPQNGQPLDIPAKTRLTFKAAK